MQACSGHPLLLLLLFLPYVACVCRHCWGTIAGCPGGAADDRCTSLTGVAANVAALAVGATTAVSVANLLPVYLLRVFTGRVIDTLTQVARRGSGATVFDYTGKGPDEIIRAVSGRQADADEAITELGIIASSAATSEALARQCTAAIRVLDTIKDRVGAVGTRIDFGRYLYIFAVVQHYVATSVGDSITLGELSSESSASGKSPTAKIRVPSSADAFYESLTLWVMVCHAAGAANALIATRFVHEAVHLTVRRLGFTWMVAFELFLLYLELVDIPQGAPVNLSAVTSQGGLDTLLAQANLNGAVRFGKSFRSKGGGTSTLDRRTTEGGGEGKSFNGKGSSDPTAGICATHNFGRDHKPSELNADGSCKKRHVCNHFVNNKGKFGRCEAADHTWSGCTTPAACTREAAAALV